MTYAEFAAQCIGHAEQHKSGLSLEALTVPAFSGYCVKHLLNTLCSLKPLHYLEVGVHQGGTFCAAMYGNQPDSSLAIDNWSEFERNGETRARFLENLAKFAPTSRFLEKDCFALTPEEIGHPVNVYFYDGNHSEESQYKALMHFLPMLADEFIWLVDDYGWHEAPSVKAGTQRAIKDSGVTVLFERDLQPPQPYDANGWWNGLYVGVLRKP
ncbi:MAG: class I SAM-dependent methyltransferase [Candidatus Dormibacteria bacterium]